MRTTISSQMDEIEVINVLKRYSNKKRVIKSPVFLFSAAIWSYLAHSWSGLNCMCKVKYKALENDKYIIITFPLKRNLAF